VTHVPRSPRQSTIDVEQVDGEWMVVQRLTPDDARATAFAFGPRDGVYDELLKAADDVERHAND